MGKPASPESRFRRTRDLGELLSPERHRILDGASPERLAQMRAAERRGAVFAAWNAVVGGTREGAHATGLHYVPETDELVVYMDSPAWTQEMTMLREIVRARMASRGAQVAAISFKTTRPGYAKETPRARESRVPGAADRPAAPRADLSAAEAVRLEGDVAPIEDARLREALKKAMKASFEWKKGSDAAKKA